MISQRITITDVRKVFCVDGVRKWADEHGLDFRDFVKNGIGVEELKGKVGADACESIINQILEVKRGQ